MEITTLYDNYPFADGFRTGFGFSALIEGEKTILFDAGGDSPTLLHNLRKAGKRPDDIDLLFFSHSHGDHTGGAYGLLENCSRPDVYLLSSFPSSLKQELAELAEIVEVDGPTEISSFAFSTGELGGWTGEQSLVLKTGKGLAVLTGCAHPGIVKILEKAKELGGDDVFLAMGGFHLNSASRERLLRVIEGFRDLGVGKVAPSHCTGDVAISLFEKEYGDDFIRNGVGRKISLASSQF